MTPTTRRVAAALLPVLAAAAAPAADPRLARPNVIVFLVDDMGWID